MRIDREPVRTAVVRELALAESTRTEIAARHGVDQSTVSSFAARHADRIAEVRARLDDEWAGVTYAAKTARVAVLGQQVDDVAAMVEHTLAGGRAGERPTVEGVCALMRTQLAALRAVADELGQIPARVTVEHTGGLDVRVNGVDLDDLT